MRHPAAYFRIAADPVQRRASSRWETTGGRVFVARRNIGLRRAALSLSVLDPARRLSAKTALNLGWILGVLPASSSLSSCAEDLGIGGGLWSRRSAAGVVPELRFRWFLPSIWRYRKPLAHVLLASLFVQIFALVTPLFFQIVVDKVLVHKGYSTLFVLVVGIVVIGLFDVLLQFLRTYALSHTTNRIDVELGRRLFHHLLRLPLGYFETRAAGQTVARVRELETIRQFLTGQGLFSALDLVFAVVFIAVLFAYSWALTLIVVLSIPFYILIAALVRPALREQIKEKFNRGAESQQFLVETVVGVQTLKAAAVEPMMQAQWEERLAAYVRTAFDATMLGGRRPERHPIRQQGDHGADPVFRGAGGHRRADDGRRAHRLQHDRQPGGAADPAAVAALAGFPAGAGLGRAARRHPQTPRPSWCRAGQSTWPPRRDRASATSRSATGRARPTSSRACPSRSRPGEVIGIVGPSGPASRR